jgi:hypothetical protein
MSFLFSFRIKKKVKFLDQKKGKIYFNKSTNVNEMGKEKLLWKISIE